MMYSPYFFFPLRSHPSSQIFFLLFLGLFLFSCGQEKTELVWTEQVSGVDIPLHAIHFVNEQQGYAVGGDGFNKGVQLSTDNAGQTWQLDTLTGEQIHGLGFSLDGRGHNVGVKGLFRSDDELDVWWFQGLEIERPIPTMNDIAFRSNDRGLIVGGAAFQDGYILRLGTDYALLSLDSFENEISAVTFSDDQTAHAVGYGIVLRTTDGGLSWERNSVNSDFYRAVHFPSANVGYAVGYIGTILKTTDAGKTWEKLRNGDKIFVGDKPFRSVFFVDEEKGFIVGDNGLFWLTSDGGEQWQEVRDFPDVDLHDIFAINGNGYIVGGEGRIFQFVF
jgi:Uncharacterized protein related to plant photosystem II stability/assembly factor